MSNEKMEKNEVQKLDDTQTTEVAGGYTALIDWPSWKKRHCDNCGRVIGENLKGLQSPDNKHHICQDCIKSFKEMIPSKDGKGGYIKYIKENYGIDVSY